MSTPIDSTATACCMPLPRYGFLAVRGAKAADFLQGQLSCDVREAAPGRVLPGAYCTPKGRVVASFLLWRRAEGEIVLRLHADLLAETAAVLRKYGVFSRVEVVALDGELACAGIIAPPALLDGLLTTLPATAGALVQEDGIALLCRDPERAVLEAWLPPAQLGALQQRLAARLHAGSEADWSLALVRGGAAEIRAATREHFLPHMLGYDRTGAVSFRKGCYTGQEIVARTHYKGTVKRHLRRFAGTLELAPGSALAGPAGQAAAGEVIECAPCPGGGFEVLAVASDAALEDAGSELFAPGGTPLRDLGIVCAMI